MQNIKTVLYGSSLGISTFSHIDHKNKSKSTVINTLSQLLLFENGLMIGDLLHQNVTGIPLAGRITPRFLTWIALSPVIFAVLSRFTNQSTWHGKTITWIHNHMDTVGVIATSVSAVALIVFGSHVMGISFLVGSAFEALCQRDIIPICAQKATMLVQKTFYVAFFLCFSSWPFKIMSMIEVTRSTLQHFFKIDTDNILGKLIKGKHFNRNVEKTPLTEKIVTSVLTSSSPTDLVEINYRHFDEKNFSNGEFPQEIFSTLQSYRRELCEKIIEAYIAMNILIRYDQFVLGEDFAVLVKNSFMDYLQEPFAYKFNDETSSLFSLRIGGAILWDRDQLVKYFHDGGFVKGQKLTLKNGENRSITFNDLTTNNYDEKNHSYLLSAYNVNNIILSIHNQFFPIVTPESEEVIENQLIKYLFETDSNGNINKESLKKLETTSTLEKFKSERKFIILLLIHLGVFNFKS